MLKNFYGYHAPLKDGEDLSAGGDRGDEVVVAGEKPPTDEERRVAEEAKTKEKADAEAKAKADAEAKAKAEAKTDDDDDLEDDPERPGQKRRKDTRIPVKRHKEILEAERAERAKVEARLAQYEKGRDIAETNEEITKAEEALLKMEKDYTKLVTDGKNEEAADLMSRIRRTERSINEAKTEMRSQEAEARAYERARYDITVDRIEAVYPQLRKMNVDEDGIEEANAEFNPVLTRKVLTVSRAYQMEGMPPAQALQEAVKDILGPPQTKKQENAVETKARVDDAAAKKAAREEEARRKAAEAAGRQPPNEKPGKDSDKLGGGMKNIDVMKLSFSDFSKLDEAELSRMRGDMVE